MYEIIKNVINTKGYELADMLYKINKMYIEAEITEEQKEELDNLARTNATAENSYAPMQEQIDKAFKEIDLLKSTVEANAVGLSALKDAVEKLGGKIETTIEPSKEEYPEFVQPQGAHDAYNIRDKVTYSGKKYICQMNGCVWTPDAYPAGWKEVVESEEK